MANTYNSSLRIPSILYNDSVHATSRDRTLQNSAEAECDGRSLYLSPCRSPLWGLWGIWLYSVGDIDLGLTVNYHCYKAETGAIMPKKFPIPLMSINTVLQTLYRNRYFAIRRNDGQNI